MLGESCKHQGKNADRSTFDDIFILQEDTLLGVNQGKSLLKLKYYIQAAM